MLNKKNIRNNETPTSHIPNKPEINPISKPVNAAADHMIFSLNIVLNDSFEPFRLRSDSVPIPKRAAATILAVKGSTACQPNALRNVTGAIKRGRAKRISAAKCITNHMRRALGTSCSLISIFKRFASIP